MLLTTRLRTFAWAVIASLVVTACGPKDAEIQTAAQAAVAGAEGVTVQVVDGVATIAGEFADETSRMAAQAAVQGVRGVKSVVNNATVTPPVVISPDELLKTSVDAVLKDFSTLSASVSDGVVTLTGEIRRAELPRVMQALSALNPKQIQNNARVR